MPASPPTIPVIALVSGELTSAPNQSASTFNSKSDSEPCTEPEIVSSPLEASPSLSSNAKPLKKMFVSLLLMLKILIILQKILEKNQ